MATYQYQCEDCNKHFDVRVSMAEYDVKKSYACAKCDSTRTKRVYSAPQLMGVTNESSGPGPAAGGSCCGSSCGCH